MTRPPWPTSGRREVAIGLGAYGAYLLVRRVATGPPGRSRAVRNAQRLVAWEERAGVAVEQPVQRWALRWPRLGHVLNAGYAAGNLGLSVGWLLTLYHRRDPGFIRERRAAVAAFCGALPVFAAFPTAPPRMLDGYVDTLADAGLPLDHPVLVRFYNPLAAMPSHHVAFAVVTGFALAARAGGRGRRAAWRAYPLLVTAVVVATGNHFVADAAAGAALGAVARRWTR